MQKAVLITGMSGSGKTTIAEKLASVGKKAIDMDEFQDLCAMYYKESKEPVMTEFCNHDLPWVQSVEWICDIQKLKAIMAQHPDIQFYCGSADNLPELFPLFDRVILLRAEEKALRMRLSHRTNNDWGRTKEVQDWLVQRIPSFEKPLMDAGAISVDANQTSDAVTAQIIAMAGLRVE